MSSRRGDFSRFTFDPAKRHSAVLMQQGRVQLDSDWNEQVDIVAHRLRAQAMDFIGATGAPAGSSGFEIVPRASLRFDGKERYLSLGHTGSETYSSSSALTIEARVRPRQDGSGGVVFCRFDRLVAGEPLQYTYLLSILPDGRLGLNVAGSSKQSLTSNRELAYGRWSRIALSHDRNEFRLSIDGRPAGSIDRGFDRKSLGAFFLVGLSHLKGEGAPGFDGSLSEIRLSGQAPAAGGGEGGDEVLGWWRFDRGAGDVVLDRSGQGNHAILGGGKAEARPSLELDDLLISAGRYYAGGILCENQRTVGLRTQPDLPGLTLPTNREAGSSYLVYLDVWERYVSPAEDPSLREPALGGADTAGRTRVVTQTRWLPVELDEMPADPKSGVAEWDRLLRTSRGSGRLQVRLAEGGYRGLENRLYRIEVHGATGTGAAGAPASGAATDPPPASFKWSRDNASTAAPIVSLEKGSPVLGLASTGDGDLAFSPGDWVEIADEQSVLLGETSDLFQVVGADPETRTVTLDRPPHGDTGTRPDRNPVAVRWDGHGPIQPGEWQRLEKGIEARFVATATTGAGGFRPGDHWTFASRTTTAAIDWPADASGEPAARPPHGVDHHLSPLAILRFEEWGFELRDCRPVFQPLSTGAVSKAGDRMHGPLEIRPNAASGAAAGDDEAAGGGNATPALLVSGTAQADTLLGAIGSPGAVETFSLADGAVTRSKISPDVGTVPAGYAILGDSPTPPPGFEYTGNSVVIPSPDPEWASRTRLAIGEEPAELHSAAVGERVFTFSSSGRAWSFDAGRSALEERQPMPEPRGRFAAAAAHGKVYLIGGVDHDGEKVGSTLEYDPALDAWSWREAMPTPRCDVGLAVSGGKLYAIGGLRDLFFLEVVSRRNEVYDPLVDTWTRRRAAPTARYAMTAASSGLGVFTFGGRRRWFLRWLGQAVSALNEEYMPGVDRWSRRPNPMPAPRSEGAAAVVGNAIFLVGGRSLFGWSADSSSFAPRGDGWEPAAPLAVPVVSPGVAAVDGRLILHASEPSTGSLEVQECRIASTFYVHRKSAETEGDLEPQLRLPAGEGQGLGDLELPDLRLKGGKQE